MVLLHAVEHGTVPPQLSQDGDVIADIRAAPSGLRKVVVCSGELGFTLEDIATDGPPRPSAEPTGSQCERRAGWHGLSAKPARRVRRQSRGLCTAR
jgi:hypothetical protein